MSLPLRLHVITFGCQMNKLDSETIAGQLLEAGYQAAGDLSEADVVLINTCSVRQHAEDKVWSLLGTLRRRKTRDPDLIIAVLGCMAQREQKAILARMPHVDVVCGPMDLPRLPALLAGLRARREQVVAVDSCGPVELRRVVARRPSRFQAFVSVMRGCDNFCSYCIVPHVRGRERSRPPAQIVAEVRRLADDGCREVTLLGQNVSSYGRGLAEPITLAGLLERLDPIDGLDRIRFVTSHPKDATDELFRAMADLPKVCPHLHLPAQAGSDRILGLMNRGYTRDDYLERVARVRALVPGVELASDFIVGFPTETDAEYGQTVDLVERAEFQNCFIFKYSPRPGTRAADMPDDVPLAVKKQRNNHLLAVQQGVMARRQAARVGRVVEVLVEGVSKNDPARLIGRTRANHIVAFAGGPGLEGHSVALRITGSTPLTLFGERVADR